MENNELLKRGEDLARRCENKGCLTSTGFLTPAEQYALAHDAELRFSRMVFRGGHEDFERGMAFFLPDYMEEAELIESEPGAAIGFAAYLSARIRFLTRRIEALTAGDSASKLLSYLLEREQDGKVDIQSCAELARRLDVGRASLYRALDSLETSGDIRREGKKIFITVKDRG